MPSCSGGGILRCFSTNPHPTRPLEQDPLEGQIQPLSCKEGSTSTEWTCLLTILATTTRCVSSVHPPCPDPPDGPLQEALPPQLLNDPCGPGLSCFYCPGAAGENQSWGVRWGVATQPTPTHPKGLCIPEIQRYGLLWINSGARV